MDGAGRGTGEHQLQSQFKCQSCATVLAFPVGAPSVKCPICNSVTPIQNIRVQCSSCSVCLVVPQNTTVAMCPSCNNIMSVARPVDTSFAGGGGGGAGFNPGQQAKHQQQASIPKNPSLAAAMGKHNIDQ